MRIIPRTIPYALAIAVLYMGMAVAVIASPNLTILWMQASGGIHADAFVVVLSVAAAILISRPSTAWFIMCLIPLAFYMFMSVSYASAINSPNVSVAVMYALIIVIFPLAYKLCRSDGIRLHHVYGVLIVGLSMALFSSPSVATLQFIQTQYGIIGVVATGILMISAVALLLFPSPRLLTLMIGLIMLYSAVTGYLAEQRGNHIGFSVNLILCATVFYTLIKRRRYFPPVQAHEQ